MSVFRAGLTILTTRWLAPQFALTLLMEFVQVSSLLLSSRAKHALHADALVLSGSALPCIMPMRPLHALVFRGALPLSLFLILGTMLVVELSLRFRFQVLGRGSSAVKREVVVLRYVNALWAIVLACFSCRWMIFF
jgi:hypothetical protein